MSAEAAHVMFSVGVDVHDEEVVDKLVEACTQHLKDQALMESLLDFAGSLEVYISWVDDIVSVLAASECKPLK